VCGEDDEGCGGDKAIRRAKRSEGRQSDPKGKAIKRATRRSEGQIDQKGDKAIRRARRSEGRLSDPNGNNEAINDANNVDTAENYPS
jgi:hypothetical protein